jgi:hypothetical protein
MRCSRAANLCAVQDVDGDRAIRAALQLPRRADDDWRDDGSGFM